MTAGRAGAMRPTRPSRGWVQSRGRQVVQPAVFFFKQKTAYEITVRDWSSDVCSSDLYGDHDGAIEAAGALSGWGTGDAGGSGHGPMVIGRASCRERVWTVV